MVTLIGTPQLQGGGRGGSIIGRSLAVAPDGRTLYVGTDDSLEVFARDTMGGLNEVQNVPSEARVIVVSPDGDHVYVARGEDVDGFAATERIAVFARDSVTGRLTFVEEVTEGLESGFGGYFALQLTITPDGRRVFATKSDLFYAGSLAIFDRDGDTGRLTFAESQFDGVNGVTGLGLANYLAPSPDGTSLYVARGRAIVVGPGDLPPPAPAVSAFNIGS